MIRKIIENSIESTELRDAIMKTLSPYNNRMFTKNILEKLDQEVPVLLRTLKNGSVVSFDLQPKSFGGSILKLHDIIELNVSDQPKHVRVDTDFIEELNPYWFASLEERNKERRKLLSDPDQIEKIEKAIVNLIQNAQETYDLVKDLTDSYIIRKAFFNGTCIPFLKGY